jgi:hypothetical protein
VLDLEKSGVLRTEGTDDEEVDIVVLENASQLHATQSSSIMSTATATVDSALILKRVCISMIN